MWDLGYFGLKLNKEKSPRSGKKNNTATSPNVPTGKDTNGLASAQSSQGRCFPEPLN